MKCDFCDSKATVFLTQLVEGQMKKVCLCDDCAKERGVTEPTGFSLADMLLGGVQKVATGGTKGSPFVVASDKKCADCGFTLDAFAKVRRLGCPECYKVFREELSPMLRGMHKGLSHVGKVPEGLMQVQVRHQRLEELREKLEQAISSESYEEAAGIRDEIRTLDEVNK